jgi:hypothetical protein
MLVYPQKLGQGEDDGQTGSNSGPEVGLEEIAIDLLQARFWTTFLINNNWAVNVQKLLLTTAASALNALRCRGRHV